MSDEFFRRSSMDLDELGDPDADPFRADDAYAPEPEQDWAPTEGPLRVVPASEASALLRIRLPEKPPVPATTLRADAPPIERVYDAETMFAMHTNPSRPTALPGDVMALTTATMVVPMPAALSRGGVPRPGQRPALLTASVPPDFASRAEADLLSDTVEQFFGDFDAIGRELAAAQAGVAADGGGAAAIASGVSGGAGEFTPVPGPSQVPLPPQPGEEYGVGRYGVPTQFPGYDAARRSPVGMRYLGGIFHDSSGESSFYDPQTAALVPLGAAGSVASAAEFRRPAPPAERSVAAPRRPQSSQSSQRPATPPRPPEPRRPEPGSEHWTDHHPDHHHRGRAGAAPRRRTRAMLVSAVVSALAFGGLYGAALVLEGQVPKGTVVDGVAIGGMTRSAAETKLADALGPALLAPIRLTADGATLTLDPAQAGLRPDWAATVAAASADREDPFVALPAVAGTRRVSVLRVSVDRTALRAALAKAAATFDHPLVEGGVTFPGGQPTPVAPKPGRVIDLDAAVDAVANAFANGATALGPASAAGAATLDGGLLAPVALALPGPEKDPGTATPSAGPSSAARTPGSATPSPAGAAASPPAPSGRAPSATPSTPSTASTARTPDAAPVPEAPAPGSAAAIPPVALTVRDLQPTVTPAEVARAMQDFARPAMSAPVVLVTGSVKSTFKPAVIGKYLRMVPDGHGALVPKLDGTGLRSEIEQAPLARLEQPAVDAAFTVADGKPVLVPGKAGTGYSPAAISDALIPVLTRQQGSQRTATVPLGPLPPAFGTEAAQALGVKDVMGTYTAPFTASSQRTANVRRAAELLHGQVVQPGQSLSLNQVLGPRSAANGFVPANPGDANAAAQDAGAGASLVATALFNAEYLAGLRDVEHHPHASATDRFPAGLEAASSYPDVDLKFENDSGNPVYIWTQASDNTVTVAVLGQKDYASVQTEMSPHYAVVPPRTVTGSGGGCSAQEGAAGFQIDVTRILTRDGQDPVRQVFHTTYAVQDRVVCSSQGSASPGTSGPVPGPTTTPASAPSPATSGGAGSGGTGPSGGPAPPPGTTSPPQVGWDGTLLGGLLGAPQPPKH